MAAAAFMGEAGSELGAMEDIQDILDICEPGCIMELRPEHDPID